MALHCISHNGQIAQSSCSLLQGVCSPVISVGITEGRWRVHEDNNDDEEEDDDNEKDNELSQLTWF